MPDTPIFHDLNDAQTQYAQLQTEFEEIKQSLKDIKAKHAKERRDWLGEKQFREKIRMEARRQNSDRAEQRKIQYMRQLVRLITSEFEMLRLENERLLSTQELLNSNIATLQEELEEKDQTLQQCRRYLSISKECLKSFKTKYFQQCRSFYKWRTNVRIYNDERVNAERYRMKLEKELQDPQLGDQERALKERQLAKMNEASVRIDLETSPDDQTAIESDETFSYAQWATFRVLWHFSKGRILQ